MTLFGGSRGRSGVAGRSRWKELIIAASVLAALTVPMSGVAGAGSAEPVVRVRVVDGAGRPLPGVAVLATVHWSSKAQYRRFGPTRGRMLRSGAQGELVVPLTTLDRQQQRAVRRNGDWANVTVVAVDESGRPISQATTSRYLGTRADKRAQERTMPYAGLVTLTGKSADGSETSKAEAAAVDNLTSCTYYWDADGYYNRYAQVGELHADYDVRNARFTYGRTADTTFDVASKSSGLPWSISGGLHIENTHDVAVYAETAGQSNYHWALRTQFRFVNLKLFKDCIGGPYRAWVGTQAVHALEWTGNGMTMSSTLTQLPRSSSLSATYGANTGWSRSAGALVKWKATVSVWGVSLGAQSGASTNVRIDYAFGSRPTHYLYGDTALPSTATRVFQDTP